MHVSETLKFAVRHIFLPGFVVALIFLIIVLAFPTFSLTFEEFTITYWSLSIVVLPLNWKAMRWTKYIVEHYGLEKEKNPVMKRILATKNYRKYQTSLIGLYVFLFVFYILGVNRQVFLIMPSWISAVILYDFLNDFYWQRKLRRSTR